MPTYGIKEVVSFEIKDGDGNIVTTIGNMGLSGLSLHYESKLSNKEKLKPSNIEKVIFNPPATIVIFKDGTKTVVKAHNEEFDAEKGFLMAMARHMFESRSEFNRFIEKWEKESVKKESNNEQ